MTTYEDKTDVTREGPDPQTVPRADGEPLAFPHGFLWGVATSAYQVEGATAAGGRGKSIWDTFSHTPGRTHQGDTGDTSVDQYHRLDEDVAMMADLGVRAYRFSVSWPRIQPEGSGPVNQAGIDYYQRLVDRLLEHDILPFPTLYHWDLPQPLQDAGGWPERDTALRFAEYASLVHDALQDRVRQWTTLNEPWCSAFLGHASGAHAPGLRDRESAVRAAHHLLLAHGLGVTAMRENARHEQHFGVVLNLYPVSALTDEPEDVDAARRIDGLQNRIFLDPILRGVYPSDVLRDLLTVSPLTHMHAGDEKLIAAPIDLLGVNYYSPHVVCGGETETDVEPSPWPGSEDVHFASQGLPRTAMGWEVDSSGLRDVLLRLHSEYPQLPLYITENGAAYEDEFVDGQVRDSERVNFLDSHLRAARDALTRGVDIRGYFAWSLLDNFEWAHGYSKRFGLVHVDYTTLRRTWKDSARWYQQVIRRGGLTPHASSPDGQRPPGEADAADQAQ